MLNDSVTGQVYNYRSEQDRVLSRLYKTAQRGADAVGVVGFQSQFPNIADVNLTKSVSSHSGYFSSAHLR